MLILKFINDLIELIRMKKRLYSLLLMVMACVVVMQAQHRRLSKDEFRQRQQAFITEKAELNQEEAKQFFPLYFELQDKKQAYNKKAWQKMQKGKEANLTEDEYAQIIEDVIQARIDVDRLDLEYIRKYKKILSPKKIYFIQKAEMKFHRELLRNMREVKKRNLKR